MEMFSRQQFTFPRIASEKLDLQMSSAVVILAPDWLMTLQRRSDTPWQAH
jgi:hypothetical protein